MRLRRFGALKIVGAIGPAGGGTHRASSSEEPMRRRGGEIAREASRLRWAARATRRTNNNNGPHLRHALCRFDSQKKFAS